jgi:hypothetical protein
LNTSDSSLKKFVVAKSVPYEKEEEGGEGNNL